MKTQYSPHLLLLPMLLSLLLGACASTGGRDRQAPSEPSVATTPDAQDPWQPFNRRMHAFNSRVDRILLRPVARVYDRVMPKPIRTGVSNFFGNLQQPVTALNSLLQGEPKAAGESAGRFLVNLTVGVGGVFDPATRVGLPQHDTDFGQTFAVWGWQDSRYLVLPLFGPGTVRDNLGKGVNTRASPISRLADQRGEAISLLYGVDARASALSAEAFLDGASDEYLLIRDAYLQRRRCQIVDCSEEMPGYLQPDYDFEVPDFPP